MAWQTPVWDRTEQDVKAGADKCYFSADLLNRIEGNIEFLADLFRVTVHTRTWHSTDFLTVSEWQRILQDLETVRAAYVTLPQTPDTPQLPATLWNEVNDIEHILYLKRDLWDRNRANTVYAGELYAGEPGGI